MSRLGGLVLGGPAAWKVYARGGIVTAFHWVKDEPSMFIYPRFRKLMLRDVVPWCMPLSAAHELVKDGTKGVEVDSAELLAKATRCAQITGIGDDQSAIFEIADAILHGLDHLLKMPPQPVSLLRQEQAMPAAGEMTVKVDGQVVAERAV